MHHFTFNSRNSTEVLCYQKVTTLVKYMDEAQQVKNMEAYMDWRNRPAQKNKHGGILAASFVLVVEILENLAYLANASNLVLYLSKFMHFSPSSSATIVTNFMGTSFLLTLLVHLEIEFPLSKMQVVIKDGSYTSDEKRAWISQSIDVLKKQLESGLLILTVQAQAPSLKPPTCISASRNTPCLEVSGGKEALFYAGLYLVALGVGGIKGSLPPHGAEQFDENTPQGRKHRSTFFNYYVFCLACGALIAVTLVVWIEDNKGWQWGFGISTLTILISIPIFLLGSTTYRIKLPRGSPITTIFKVLAAAIYNSCFSTTSGNAIASTDTTPSYETVRSEGEEGHAKEKEPIRTPQSVTENLKFFNKAVNKKSTYTKLESTVKEVEEVKIILRILPIFMFTIMFNCCLAQLSTFSVQQAATMNTKIGSLQVPPASLPVFPVLFIMILAPMYNHIIIPFARKVTKTEMGITHLKRIGIGLVLSIFAMAIAALVEIKRKKVAIQSGLLNSTKPLPITFLWVSLQYLFLGSADLFSLAGMMDFFFTEAPSSMRSLATALSWASLAMGYYLSSVLVSIVNHVTGTFRHTPWLYGSHLNHYHLERFYWLMCVLSGVNFLIYLIWAKSYKYRSTVPDNQVELQIVCKSTGV